MQLENLKMERDMVTDVERVKIEAKKAEKEKTKPVAKAK